MIPAFDGFTYVPATPEKRYIGDWRNTNLCWGLRTICFKYAHSQIRSIWSSPVATEGLLGISPLIQNSIIFHQISECKAPLNKSKAPLLKTFWRRFWSEAIITCTVLKFWRSDIHIFRGVVERECVGTAFPDLSRVLLWNEYEAVLKWLVFWVLSHTTFVSTTSLHILTSKDKYR